MPGNSWTPAFAGVTERTTHHFKDFGLFAFLLFAALLAQIALQLGGQVVAADSTLRQQQGPRIVARLLAFELLDVGGDLGVLGNRLGNPLFKLPRFLFQVRESRPATR